MGIEVWRDWIIVIQGIIQMIFILVLIILALVLYSRVNNLIKTGKQTLYNIENNVERTFTNAYYKTGSYIVGWLTEAIWKKR